MSDCLDIYNKHGRASLKKYGVHHLSKSSCESLLECTNKFYMKSLFRTAKVVLSMGQVGHSLQESIVDALQVGADKYLSGEITLDTYFKVYPEFLDAVLEDLDLPEKIMEIAIAEINSQIYSPVEMLFPEGLNNYSSKVMLMSEMTGKSLTKDHLRAMLSEPILYAELPLVYIPGGGLEIPYTGFADLVSISREGRLKVIDLKLTFSNNQNVWTSVTTMFQVWLYGMSLVQMGVTDIFPELGITRLVIDAGLKRKIPPTSYNISVEKKVLRGIGPVAPGFESLMRTCENNIVNKSEVFALSKWGCKTCDYAERCDKKMIPEWEEEVERDD